MKSINRNDFTEVGTVLKTHGTKGELRLSLTHHVSFKQWAFLEFQGKPVPFYIEWTGGSKEDPVLKLKGVDSPDAAQRLMGRTLLFPAKQVKRSKAAEVAEVIGYKLIDETLGFIGLLEEIEELPQQTMLMTTLNGKQVLIPAVEEFIVDIDSEKQEVILDLPQGLLDI